MTNSLRLMSYAIVMLVISSCSQGFPAIAPSVGGSPKKSQALLPLQATIDLGVVIQGNSVELRSWVKNQSDKSVQVSIIESSCECLELKLSQKQVEPGERVLAHARFDGAREPAFVGALQIEVQLFDEKGMKTGKIEIPIEVVRGESKSRQALQKK